MNLSVKKKLLDDKKIPAVILPLSYNGILFTRALHSKGVPVIGLIKSKKDCFYHTNSCEKVLCSDLYGSDSLSKLKEIGECAVVKPVLIPTSDEGVKFILSNLNILQKYFLLNIPETNTADLLLEKQKLYKWGKDKFLFPKTGILNTAEDLKAASDDLMFPVIIKPNYRDANWPADLDKATICDDRESMLDAFEKFIAHADSCLISEFIPGGDDHIETCHVYYNKGKIINSYTNQKIRQYPPLTGTGAYISSKENEEIRKITTDFFDSHIEYTGIGGIEFKKDARTGEYKIIEPFVGRPSSHFYNGLGENFNFPYIVYCHIAGMEIPNYVQSKKIVSQLDEEFELQAFGYYLKTKEMTVWKYVKTLFTTQLFVRFSIKDPIVGLVYCFQVIGRLIKRRKRKLVRQTNQAI
ncbi:MAG: hypothetical protein JEY91_05310 [Spirochaetaceae bacterium]|nr:hypothetical protein [Spirochaetaceae bacterium]